MCIKFVSFIVLACAMVATIAIAARFFVIQSVLQPLWGMAGQMIAARLAGKPGEKYLMWVLAGLTVASVLFVLVKGDQP